MGNKYSQSQMDEVNDRLHVARDAKAESDKRHLENLNVQQRESMEQQMSQLSKEREKNEGRQSTMMNEFTSQMGAVMQQQANTKISGTERESQRMELGNIQAERESIKEQQRLEREHFKEREKEFTYQMKELREDAIETQKNFQIQIGDLQAEMKNLQQKEEMTEPEQYAEMENEIVDKLCGIVPGVIKNVSKSAKKSLAVVGLTSSGKSSLLRCLFNVNCRVGDTVTTEGIRFVKNNSEWDIFDIFGANDNESQFNVKVQQNLAQLHTILLVFTDSVTKDLKLIQVFNAVANEKNIELVLVRNKMEDKDQNQRDAIRNEEQVVAKARGGDLKHYFILSCKEYNDVANNIAEEEEWGPKQIAKKKTLSRSKRK